MRTYAQERPENPFERGVFQVSDGSPHYFVHLNIGIPNKALGLSPMLNILPEQTFGQDKVQTDLRLKPFLDIVALPRSRTKDPSLIVAEAKAAANSANAAVQNYFEVSSIVEHKLKFFFFAGQEQTFEDGIESEFSQNFVRIITRYKKIALDNLQKLIESHSINTEVLAEALRWLPRIEDSSTYNQRLSLLTRSLFLPWSRARDAATLALTSLGDKSAIAALKKAIELESVEELRADMEQALTYLEATSGASPS